MDASLITIMPKANAHVHANGMVANADILTLAAKHKVTLPVDHIRADGSRYWDPEDHGSFHHAYDAGVSLIRAPADLKMVVKQALLRDAAEGCIFATVLASCMNNYRGEGEMKSHFADNAEKIGEAIAEAREESGIEAVVAITAKRHLKNGTADAHMLLNAFEHFRERQLRSGEHANFITGFNMAGDEERGNCDSFKSVFERAKKLGLGCSCHAGEVRSANDVEDAIALPGVNTVGHALSAAHDARLMQTLADRRVLVEQLFTMNETLHAEFRRAPERHPAQKFHKAGIAIALGSDDPGILGTTIGLEYKKAHEVYGFDVPTLLTFTRNAIQHGFMPTPVKGRLLRKVESFASEHGILLPPYAPPRRNEIAPKP